MSTVNLNGTQLFYTTYGQGIPLMLMHGGLGLDHTYLPPSFNQLGDVAQLIYYDHRGHGRSERPESFDGITHATYVEDADALRAHLGHDKIVLFGHSYGGFLAQEYAVRFPERLAGMVLCTTAPALDYQLEPKGTEEQLAAFGAAFSRPMADDDDWRQIWTTLWQIYFKEYDPDIGQAIDATTQYNGAAWNSAGPLLGSFNMLDHLGAITVPTLIISGRHDYITPPGPGGERFHSLMPNSELIIYENSAHYPFIEEEEQFFETMRNWLARLG